MVRRSVQVISKETSKPTLTAMLAKCAATAGKHIMECGMRSRRRSARGDHCPRAKRAIRKYIESNPKAYPDTQPNVRNKFGKTGDPAHQATQARLVEMAKKEFPNDIIHQGQSIKGQPGTGGLDRQPDVWVEDRATGRVKKVYEGGAEGTVR